MWYYWSLIGIIVCVVSMVVLVLTGEPQSHLVKPLIALGLCVYFFIRERSKLRQAQQHIDE
jgi:hypothetical protein